jgi:hypothetical protein
MFCTAIKPTTTGCSFPGNSGTDCITQSAVVVFGCRRIREEIFHCCCLLLEVNVWNTLEMSAILTELDEEEAIQ